MIVIGGPRCCKRNGFISLSIAVKFVKDKYGIEMELNNIVCEFYSKNKQCIGFRCPFFYKSNFEKLDLKKLIKFCSIISILK